jgi:omega-6 fatty acid desaturase (delta-12 desaturase)
MGRKTTFYGPDAGEVRTAIPDGRRQRALGPGLASFLGASAAWVLTLAGVILLPWWAAVPFGLLNGLAIAVLFVVGHDAGHGTLFPRRWMNRLAGRAALLPALHPYTAWVHNHNGLHHGFTNIKERDPGFPPLSPEEYRALPGWRRWLYRRKRTWYGLGLLYFLDMWVKWEVLPTAGRAPRNRRAYRLDRLLVVGFAVAWLGLLVAVAGGWWAAAGLVLVGFVLPQFVWNWLIAFIIFQQHTHPRVPWYSELDLPSPSYFQAQVRATPHVHFPGPFQWLMRHIMEHTAHHIDTGVPHYHLADAQASVEREYRRDMVRVLWTRGSFLRVFRTCRLYDYATHRWVDYDGTPLTESLLPPPGETAAQVPVPRAQSA